LTLVDGCLLFPSLAYLSPKDESTRINTLSSYAKIPHDNPSQEWSGTFIPISTITTKGRTKEPRIAAVTSLGMNSQWPEVRCTINSYRMQLGDDETLSWIVVLVGFKMPKSSFLARSDFQLFFSSPRPFYTDKLGLSWSHEHLKTSRSQKSLLLSPLFPILPWSADSPSFTLTDFPTSLPLWHRCGYSWLSGIYCFMPLLRCKRSGLLLSRIG